MKVSSQLLTVSALSAALLLPATAANAAADPAGTGQPGASCQDFQTTPTSPLLVNGFNTAGFTHAAAVYAGSDGTASQAHSSSGKAVSQYDVACYQQSQR